MKVFVSYNHTDKAIAIKIATVLKAYGMQVWFDEWNIVLGDSVEGAIDEGLKATHFVFLISKNTNSSRYQRRELLSSLSGYISAGTPKIIPVLLDETTVPTIIQDLRHHRYEGGTENDWKTIVWSITGVLIKNTMRRAIIDLYKETVYVEENTDSGAWYPFGYKVCPSCGSPELAGNSFFYDENVYIEIKCKSCGWSEVSE
ncbi:MAG: toll/interleukin-1 receptor domain-containing protein [Candidatus Thermoplasmatota archaeon]|nr:toll/interleukin-1 receptor domain-containing protein [Candidatus Thermoplasmatota archaeon]